jgi:hypothetical protein
MQEGKNNEKSREGIGKDKPCQATCGNKRWYYYTGSSGAFGATGTTFFHRGTGGKLQEEDSGEWTGPEHCPELGNNRQRSIGIK